MEWLEAKAPRVRIKLQGLNGAYGVHDLLWFRVFRDLEGGQGTGAS